jgi:hypothetical protein
VSALVAALAALHLPGAPEVPRPAPCRSEACVRRVSARLTRRRWRRAVTEYGRGLLNARGACESDTSGGYRLASTGNGYWFRYQFDVAAWVGSGGRTRFGRPVGAWSVQPSPLEQDYRAVRWDAVHAGDAWPNCP